MINRATSDRLDDAIDEFEAGWTPNSRSQIESLLARHGLATDHESITELIRIDIELRYESGRSIELRDYFERFHLLMDSPEYIAEIAFEDFRSRSAKGHSISADRWIGLPGIGSETWFQQILDQPVRNISHRLYRDSDSDAAFESALEEAGFTLVQEIGDGALSKVFLGKQSDLADRYVVLKVVTEALREPESMALLQHPNIVPIYSFHRIFSRSVICMPYAGSVTLADVLGNEDGGSIRGGQSLISTVVRRVNDTRIATTKKLGIGEEDLTSTFLTPAADDHAVLKPLDMFESFSCDQLATWIFMRLASALEHSHARGVLHNDLKPSNILIRNDGEPALLDFNLSQSLHSGSLQHVGGTLPYMSPETYRAMMRQPVTPGPASDLYGLGVILFQFVTGRLPFPSPPSAATTDLEKGISTRQEPPQWRTEDLAQPGLRAIINRCLQFEPADRYQDAGQLQFDLQCEHQNLSLVNTSEPFVWKSRKWIRRNPRVTTMLVSAILLFAMVVPLVLLVMSLRVQTEEFNAIEKYESFSTESTRVLTLMMADPEQRKASGIQSGLQLLQKYNLDHPDGITELMSHQRLAEETKASETIFRHLAQILFFEADRLGQLKSVGTIESSERERFDKLLHAAGSLVPLERSRACLFLQESRASWDDDPTEAARYRHAAEQARLTNDSEVYLESIRCLYIKDFLRSSELLTSLADRQTVPAAVRWTALGRAQFRQGLFSEAKLSFTQSIDYAPDCSRLYFLRGLCRMKAKEGRKAIVDFRKAIDLEPNSSLAWFNLGIIYEGREEYGIAIDAFSHVLELSPESPLAFLHRSRAYEAIGQADAAAKDLAQGMKSQASDVNVLFSRATWFFKTDPESSLRDFDAALQLEPERASLLIGKARLLAVQLNRPTEAIELYRKAATIEPENETPLIDQAVLLARQGRFPQARLLVQKALKTPNSASTIYNAACVNALNPKPANQKRAVVLLSQAIRQGYERRTGFESDEDLSSLHEREDFQTVLKAFRISRVSRSSK